MNNWNHCKNILCIRPDNMGDLIMTGPAFRAVQQTFDCRITLLTSAMGALIAPYIPAIHETIVCTLPWVKSNTPADETALQTLLVQLRGRQFDAAIIFTVYSQNPLPSALLAYLAGIPLRLAYCRENPYDLLTDWIPDEEPYRVIQHQVKRDLALVEAIGAMVTNQKLQLCYSTKAIQHMQQKLQSSGVSAPTGYIVLHPGVSEKRREVPTGLWVRAALQLQAATGLPVLITGSEQEKVLANTIQQLCGEKVVTAAGLFSVEEFIALVAEAKLVVCVNTATAHIAAAVGTPVVVLYALTNPQHYPWSENSTVLPFSVTDALKSRNQVVDYVSTHCMEKDKPLPSAETIVQAGQELLTRKKENPAV